MKPLTLLTLFAFLPLSLSAQAAALSPVIEHKDIVYARVSGLSLKLDLYLPREVETSPLLIWIHGGAWRSGSKENCPLAPMTKHGFAVASISYRLSPVAQFPAQAYDINAAIRFLRASSPHYGYDPKKFAIAGASAGGHLAALIATANGNPELEGDLGNHLDQSSDVQAAINLYGCGNFLTLLEQTPNEEKRQMRAQALTLLLGDIPARVPKLAALASPALHISDTSAPMLFIHGEEDIQMPFIQGKEFYEAYKASGIKTEFIPIAGAGHGGKAFYTSERQSQMAAFLIKAFGN
ncbi:MAG: alpha/beta hydrolase [Verrucomicrobiota bacterium]